MTLSNFRVVRAGIFAAALMFAGGRPCAADEPSPSPSISVTTAQTPPAILKRRESLPEERPPLRGFRAPILEHADTPWPFVAPGESAPAELRRAADLVNRRLSFDGLLPTMAQALEALGPLNPTGDADRDLELLRQAGLPVDLLAYFTAADGPQPAAAAGDRRLIVSSVRTRLHAGRSSASLRAELAAIPFHFTPSRAGFRVAVESGEHEIGTLRLQLTRGGYWTCAGDGSGFDIARQLVEKLPGAQFIVSIERQYLDSFLDSARLWPLTRPGQLEALAEPMVVSQWAADNGKAGLLAATGDAATAPATIVPRYASRRDDGSVFIPGESFLIDTLAASGHAVIQSPLVFQGGNLMPVRDPATGQRLLLIGDAELYRNTALGLSREQALDAFRVEFGVDRCVVIPTVSFHLDYDVCIRAVGVRLVAFVNDPRAAALTILRTSVEALQRGGALDSSSASAATTALSAGRFDVFLESMIAPVQSHADSAGRYPLSFSNMFSTGPADSGVANLRLFLLAMDTVVSWSLADLDKADAHTQAYMRSFRRQEAARLELNRQLTDLGFKVVAIPGTADGDRSINYLNGIHDRTRYIMPAYGGLYAPLDDAAKAAFERELGPQVTVIPILSGESQRRFGAVHCSVGVYPRIP